MACRYDCRGVGTPCPHVEPSSPWWPPPPPPKPPMGSCTPMPDRRGVAVEVVAVVAAEAAEVRHVAVDAHADLVVVERRRLPLLIEDRIERRLHVAPDVHGAPRPCEHRHLDGEALPRSTSDGSAPSPRARRPALPPSENRPDRCGPPGRRLGEPPRHLVVKPPRRQHPAQTAARPPRREPGASCRRPRRWRCSPPSIGGRAAPGAAAAPAGASAAASTRARPPPPPVTESSASVLRL